MLKLHLRTKNCFIRVIHVQFTKLYVLYIKVAVTALLEYIDLFKIVSIHLSGRGKCPDIEGTDKEGLTVLIEMSIDVIPFNNQALYKYCTHVRNY